MGELQQIGVSCLKIGTLGFGGGYAAVGMVEREMVMRRGFLSKEEFEDLLALVQLVPGPTTVSLVSAIGYRRAGGVGLVLAGTLVVLPSFLMVLLLAGGYALWAHGSAFAGAMAGISAAVVGLLLRVELNLLADLRSHLGLDLVVAGTFLLAFLGVSPLLLLLAAATGGVAWGLLRGRRGP